MPRHNAERRTVVIFDRRGMPPGAILIAVASAKPGLDLDCRGCPNKYSSAATGCWIAVFPSEVQVLFSASINNSGNLECLPAHRHVRLVFKKTLTKFTACRAQTMTEQVRGVALTEVPTTSQRMFVRYLMATFIDLTVLNLFEEYWDHVTVNSFAISILAAILLQVLLKATLVLEHRVAAYFNSKSGATAKFLRFFVAWLILFGSKFVMLGAIDLVFGDSVQFTGPIHGVVAFIVVVVVMLIAEEAIVRIFRRLAA